MMQNHGTIRLMRLSVIWPETLNVWLWENVDWTSTETSLLQKPNWRFSKNM